MPKGFLEYKYFKILVKVQHHFGHPPLYFNLLFLGIPLLYLVTNPPRPRPPSPANCEIVTHFWPILLFYTLNPFVPDAPFFYVMFSGSREGNFQRVHWERMG